jgi:hypothetical protein
MYRVTWTESPVCLSPLNKHNFLSMCLDPPNKLKNIDLVLDMILHDKQITVEFADVQKTPYISNENAPDLNGILDGFCG